MPPAIPQAWDWCGIDPATNAMRGPGDAHPEWPSGFVPRVNEDVFIALGKNVTVDCVNTARVNKVTVQGVLKFKENVRATLRARLVIVDPLGKVLIGQSTASPARP